MRTLEGHEGEVWAVAVTAGRPARALRLFRIAPLRLWDLASGQSCSASRAMSAGRAVAVTPDGQRAVSRLMRIAPLGSGTWSGKRAAALRGPWRTGQGGGGDCRTAGARSPGSDDGRCAALGPGERARSWRPWRAMRPGQGGGGDCRTAGARSRAQTTARSRLWDLASGRSLQRPWRAMSAGINAVAVTPDGRRALSGSDDWHRSRSGTWSGKSCSDPGGHRPWSGRWR